MHCKPPTVSTLICERPTLAVVSCGCHVRCGTVQDPECSVNLAGLPAGQFGFLADPQRVPRGILETYLETTLHTMKQILHAHLKLAQMGEMSLRDYLEDIAGYRTAGW